jgi:hypothetical protein
MHMTGKYAVPVGGGQFHVQLEGNFPDNAETRPPAYDVPYKMMLPKRGTGTNLLVPVSLSTSHAAFASTRIETMLVGTGTAAGVAAQQLVDGSVATVQDVDVAKVQAILVGVFDQQIHASGNTLPKYYDVAQAGSAAWNGRYTRVATGSYGTEYQNANKDCPNNQPCSLYAYADSWRLATEGKELFYTAGKQSLSPPLTGWVAADGALPAPVLTAGPMP